MNDGGPGYVEEGAKRENQPEFCGLHAFRQSQASGKRPTEEDHYRRTIELFKDYNSVGDEVGERSADPVSIERYQKMLSNSDLTVRLAISQHIETLGPVAKSGANPGSGEESVTSDQFNASYHRDKDFSGWRHVDRQRLHA